MSYLTGQRNKVMILFHNNVTETNHDNQSRNDLHCCSRAGGLVGPSSIRAARCRSRIRGSDPRGDRSNRIPRGESEPRFGSRRLTRRDCIRKQFRSRFSTFRWSDCSRRGRMDCLTPREDFRYCRSPRNGGIYYRSGCPCRLGALTCFLQQSSYATCLAPSASVRSSRYRFSLTHPPHCVLCSSCFASAPARRFYPGYYSGSCSNQFTPSGFTYLRRCF